MFCNHLALARGQRGLRLAAILGATILTLAISAGSALAHSYPQTTDPQSNARLDSAPAHIGITYDSNIAPSGSSMVLLDATGSAVQTAADPTNGNRQTSIHPTTDLASGPYTVDWTSVSADDGHSAQGFYTGIIAGQAQAQAQAADLMATLTVTAGADGSSLLRVDLDNPTGVERVRIRLSRPDLGEDLLTTAPTGDSGWALSGNEVAVPGAWHAVVIV
ncbi:MAG: copper resistance protein CopC, partial [Chloroflexi bacterium]